MEEQPATDITQQLDRPARKQVPGPVTSEKSDSRTGEVNLWSGRRLGPRLDGGHKGDKRSRQPSKYRCCVATDAGRTRGSEGQVNLFCLFFAKGMCYQGFSCTFLHRVPTSADNEAMLRNTSQDIFGREKLPDHLDNRKGAGSYDRDMTTVYVNYGGAGHYATPQLRHLLIQNFGEFGPIRRVYIVPSKTIAFVTYHWRASAEFAKEAMDSQTLSGSTMNEVLSVRWANEDPNPVAVVGRKREALDAAEVAALAAWDALAPEEKKARLALMHQAQARKVTPVADCMPDALLAAGQGGLLQGTGREQFDTWRGLPAEYQEQDELQQTQQQQQRDQDGAAADAEQLSAQQAQQQHQQQQGYDYSIWQQDPQWAQYPPEYLAQSQAYYKEQQQPGAQAGANTTGEGASWYQGWRERQKPAGASNLPQGTALVQQQIPPEIAAEAVADDRDTVHNLMAGYGSDSGAENDAIG